MLSTRKSIRTTTVCASNRSQSTRNMGDSRESDETTRVVWFAAQQITQDRIALYIHVREGKKN